MTKKPPRRSRDRVPTVEIQPIPMEILVKTDPENIFAKDENGQRYFSREEFAEFYACSDSGVLRR